MASLSTHFLLCSTALKSISEHPQYKDSMTYVQREHQTKTNIFWG